MQVTALTVGQMAANCYLVWDPKSLKSIIIDPGDDAQFIQNRIRDFNLTPIKIIATHAHFDHLQAVLELQLAYNIPFVMHKDDIPLLTNYRSSTKYYTGFDPGPPPMPDNFLKHNQNLKTVNNSIKIIHTPGHTPGSICLYSKQEKILFSGDTIFAGGAVGRTDFSYSNAIKLGRSIFKVLKLPKDTTIYPGHGNSTTVTQEIIAHKNMHQEG